jgi:hypothetical protein
MMLEGGVHSDFQSVHIEPDALGERQRAAIVDRVGGAAHVGFPCVRPGFTPAAGWASMSNAAFLAGKLCSMIVLVHTGAVSKRLHQPPATIKVKSTGRPQMNARPTEHMSAIAVDRDAADIAFRFRRFRHGDGQYAILERG